MYNAPHTFILCFFPVLMLSICM